MSRRRERQDSAETSFEVQDDDVLDVFSPDPAAIAAAEPEKPAPVPQRPEGVVRDAWRVTKGGLVRSLNGFLHDVAVGRVYPDEERSALAAQGIEFAPVRVTLTVDQFGRQIEKVEEIR